jgi:5-methylcytosine-specific restriction endonuclease McrA
MKETIARLLSEKTTYSEIVRIVGCSKATISYYAKKLGLRKSIKSNYDWPAIAKYYYEGHSTRECRAKFGFSNGAWGCAVRRGAIIARSNEIPASTQFVSNSLTKRSVVKKKILKNKWLRNVCAICGLEPTWQGHPLVLVLDHINGIPDDHRLENLRLICPNCNSQTPTFAGRNVK